MRQFKVVTVRVIGVEDDSKTAEDVRQAFIAEAQAEVQSESKSHIEAADGIDLEYVERDLIDIAVQSL